MVRYGKEIHIILEWGCRGKLYTHSCLRDKLSKTNYDKYYLLKILYTED